MFEHSFRYVFGERHLTYRNPLYAIVQPELVCSIGIYVLWRLKSTAERPARRLWNALHLGRAFAKALNYGRSLGLILDKKGAED